MEKYEEFELEIVRFENIDVIAASSDTDLEWDEGDF